MDKNKLKEILLMPAGPDLDAIVAEEVFLKRVNRTPSGPKITRGTCNEPVPNYSSDKALAVDVINAMSDAGFFMEQKVFLKRKFVVRFIKDLWDSWSIRRFWDAAEDTDAAHGDFALAVARAAVYAKLNKGR